MLKPQFQRHMHKGHNLIEDYNHLVDRADNQEREELVIVLLLNIKYEAPRTSR